MMLPQCEPHQCDSYAALQSAVTWEPVHFQALSDDTMEDEI